MATIRTTPRPQDEILARTQEAYERDPLLGTEASDLAMALDREHLAALDWLDQDKIAALTDEEIATNTPEAAHAAAVDYMDFALGKANNQRGISAYRSLCHYAAWLWLCLEDADYAAFDESWEHYTDYGLPQLAIARDLLGMES
jgi:hypothetical protein